MVQAPRLDSGHDAARPLGSPCPAARHPAPLPSPTRLRCGRPPGGSVKNLVTRVDAATNHVAATIPVGPKPRFLAAGLGAVWILNQGDGTVSRIDPASNKVVATIALETPGNGGDIAIGAGAVWVTNLGTPLSRIDPATNQVTAQFVGAGGDALRVGLGSVWLCSFGLQQVWRIDPSQV